MKDIHKWKKFKEGISIESLITNLEEYKNNQLSNLPMKKPRKKYLLESIVKKYYGTDDEKGHFFGLSIMKEYETLKENLKEKSIV